MKRYQLLVPDMPSREEIAPYLAQIDAARWYSNFGPLNQALEARLAGRFRAASGRPAAVSVANATLGLELALLAMRLPAGSRVLLPALTFVASAASIVRAGHVPVLCDVAERNWLLTPGIARGLVRSAKIAAVMPVATYGCAEEVSAWDRFAAESGVPVVIDAAGAFDNQTDAGRSCAVFSLHATKSLAAGEGGFVVTTDTRLLAEVRRLSNFGIELPGGMVPSVGTNAKLSEYHAAVALASLDGWSARRERRVAVHRLYLDALARLCPTVMLQQRPPEGVYSIMPVLLPERSSAQAVLERLGSQGIETRRWYCPTLEKHPAFRDLPIAGGLRVSGMLNARLLALPFHGFLKPDDVEAICAALAAALADTSR